MLFRHVYLRLLFSNLFEVGTDYKLDKKCIYKMCQYVHDKMSKYVVVKDCRDVVSGYRTYSLQWSHVDAV